MSLRFFATFLLFIAAFPLTAFGQALDYKTIISQATFAPVILDAAFEVEKQRRLDLYFSVSVPIAPGVINVTTNFDDPSRFGELAFYGAENQMAELTGYSLAQIDPGTPAQRQEYLAGLIQNQVIPALGELAEFNSLGAREMLVGPYQAVEHVALYKDAGLGQIILRIVGVFPPSGEQTLIMMSHTIVPVMPLQSPNELPETFAGTVLESLQFIATRDADGVLTTF